MGSQLNKFLSFVIGKPVGAPAAQPAPRVTSAHKQIARRQSLIRQEAQIGTSVLGAVPEGHQREFFCLDRYTWVWSEQWTNAQTGLLEHMNVRYEVQPSGVLKIVNGIPRGYIEGKELKNFVETVKTYTNRVSIELYGQVAVA